MMRSLTGVALTSGAMMALQGCGGGGSGPTTTVTTTTTTIEVGPGGFPWCEEIATFYANVFGEDGTHTAIGQCKPSENPGAYYTKPGERAEDGKSDRYWSCWSEDFPQYLRTQEAAREHQPIPFQGACKMKGYGKGVKPDQVKSCMTYMDHHPASCSPGPSAFWGSCWSNRSEVWKCIPNGDATIVGDAAGDCRSQVVTDKSGAPQGYFFDGVCKFEIEEEKVYKCETVPTYSEGNGGTCGQAVDTTDDKACFSLANLCPWKCFDTTQEFGTPCDWDIQAPDPHCGSKQGFYKSKCIFKRAGMDKWNAALDASNLTMAQVAGIQVSV